MVPTQPTPRVFNLSDAGDLWVWRVGDSNLSWLLVRPSGEALAVDVPEARSLLALIDGSSLRLSHLLFTHDHADHVDGVKEVVRRTGCRVWGHPDMALPVPVTPVSVGKGGRIGDLRVDVLNTSGHSALDLSYHFPALGVCFCGDTLFDGGCGRMFAGPPDRFWASLQSLRALPPATWLCVGHDYAEDNFRFARTVLPDDSRIESGWQETLRAAPWFRFPVTVGQQREQNVFLRADDPAVATALTRKPQTSVEVFAELRERKNQF